jgi:hypothetical protein
VIFSISRIYFQKQEAKMRLSERLSQLEDFLTTQPVIEVAGNTETMNYHLTETMLEK